MSDKVDELGTQVDDALITVDELERNPGNKKDRQIDRVKDALEEAQDAVDEIADSDDLPPGDLARRDDAWRQHLGPPLLAEFGNLTPEPIEGALYSMPVRVALLLHDLPIVMLQRFPA